MHIKALIYYVLSWAIMTVYGDEFCPFIETLPVWQWALVMAVAYVIGFASRQVLERQFVIPADQWEQGRMQFRVDLVVGLGIGLGVTLFDMVIFSFPVESGLKILVGTTCFAFFTALDMTMAREREVALHAEEQGQIDLSRMPFRSLTRRLSVLAACWALFNAAIIAMVVFKDIVYLRSVPVGDLKMHAGYVAAEIVFVSILLLGFTIRVLFSYTRNLDKTFRLQTEVLDAVGTGDLDHTVPIISSDEFGRIAMQTNHMIEGLREKNRIRSVLGKVVAPGIAKRLIEESEEGLRLGGERRDLVIFMSDIRDFTTWSEKALPEEVVRDLNAYFTACVEIIKGRGGMVDKFIGDGVLAVFGLGRAGDADDIGDEPPADAAVLAALEIHGILADLNEQFSEPMRVGFGLHVGSVISGLVGSPDRLEFTVIGDAVNTAARIESLSRTLQTPLLISGDLHAQLSDPALKARFESRGDHCLKGKSESVSVWSLKGWD